MPSGWMNTADCRRNMLAAYERQYAAAHERATRLANAAPGDQLSIRREYYVSKSPVSVSDLTPWGSEQRVPNDDHYPSPQQQSTTTTGTTNTTIPDTVATPTVDNISVTSEAAPISTTSGHYDVNATLNSKVYLYSGDILSVEVDARVNADNYSEHPSTETCSMGDAVISENPNFTTPAPFDIYTVGPQQTTIDADAVLASCYRRCLEVLRDSGLRSVVFLGIAIGPHYGLPLSRATHIALQTTRAWLEVHSADVDAIVFCHQGRDVAECTNIMHTYFPRL